MKNKYIVKRDRQNTQFGMYRLLTIEQWRKQAMEWAFMDDNCELKNYISKLPQEEVLSFIDLIWDLEFEKVSNEDLLIYEKAQEDYMELDKKVRSYKGGFETFCKRLGGHNLNENFFDLNYKNICATIYKDEEGTIYLGNCVEIWKGLEILAIWEF